MELRENYTKWSREVEHDRWRFETNQYQGPFSREKKSLKDILIRISLEFVTETPLDPPLTWVFLRVSV